nr:hypothetical protein CFP56_23301 [Quercus suber]
MSEFGSTNSPSSSKRRKLDECGLPRSVSTDSLNDVLSLDSSHTSPSRDVLREDSFGSESSEFNSEVGLSGYASVSKDDGTPPPYRLDRPFILPNKWEVNKHCSSLSD